MPTILDKSAKISLIGSSLYPDFLALFALPWALCQHDHLSGVVGLCVCVFRLDKHCSMPRRNGPWDSSRV